MGALLKLCSLVVPKRHVRVAERCNGVLVTACSSRDRSLARGGGIVVQGLSPASDISSDDSEVRAKGKEILLAALKVATKSSLLCCLGF